jgi:VIT1/CCC1 family predicted Fe2+/Mn2+ transporter
MKGYIGGRPTETISLAVGGLTLATFELLQAWGVHVPEQVPAATNVFVGAVAAVVTYFVNSHRRSIDAGDVG